MSYTANAIASGTPLGRVAFRKTLIHQAERMWIMRDLVGTREDSIIQLQDEPSREATDTVRVRFSPTRDHEGFGPDDTVTGNAPDVEFEYDSFIINQHKLAIELKRPMAQQRTDLPLKKTALQKLPIMWKRYQERSILWQMAGWTPANTDAGLVNAGYSRYKTKGTYAMTGMNAATAFDSQHTYFAKGKADAAAVGADNSCVMSLRYIEHLEYMAASSDSMDYPILPGPDGFYYLVVSSLGALQLRNNMSSMDWNDIRRALLEGGQKWQDSAIFNNYLGRHSKTIICVSDFLGKAVATADSANVEANTRYGLFMGAKFGVLSYGMGYTGGDHLDWKEQVADYDKWGVACDSVWGCKRLTFPDLSGTTRTYGGLLLVHNAYTG